MEEKTKAFQVIDYADVKFENPHPDVHVAKILIANASWINTTEGTVLVDTLLYPGVASKMKDRILETGGGPVKHIVYTHHHPDHIGGASVFQGDNPEIIAHRFLPEDLEKYRILNAHRARVASIQFNIPLDTNRIRSYVQPTRTFDTETSFTLGDKTFELYHARAETDDAVWVFVPEIKAVFAGDLIISGFPNIGNPFKPTRFALPWARALEAMRAKKPELLIAHGGRAVYQGDDVGELLDVTIEAVHSIHDQVVDCINQDMPLDEMIHVVALPDHLKDSKYLRFSYSRPEFAVYNIYRWYHGYFDHNPAHLLPRPDREVNTEIFDLIGDAGAILNRSTQLFEGGQSQLALQVLDILLKKDPDDLEARKLHLKILEVLCEEDYCLMSRNTWVHFMDKDKEILRSKGEL
ncbi:MAG: MBL fold metallo-hydrolase [Proteobacteria bacterium]|nr:MBL fold metallo-hydrolase [Pseudomonadota bacterium]